MIAGDGPARLAGQCARAAQRRRPASCLASMAGCRRGKGGAGRLAGRVSQPSNGLIASARSPHGGSLKPVYEMLGISRKTLYEKMQKYGLDKKCTALRRRAG